MTILLLTLLAAPITFMEVADLTCNNPDIDFGLGIGYQLAGFENDGNKRLGLYIAADLNPDLSRPEWISFGAFISREIQINVTIGGIVGYRLGTPEGLQAGLMIGFDLWPWRTR